MGTVRVEDSQLKLKLHQAGLLMMTFPQRTLSIHHERRIFPCYPFPGLFQPSLH